MPTVRSVRDARQNPEVAVLSAIAHGHDKDVERSVATVVTTTKALFAMNHPHSTKYYDLMQAALSAAARKAFEMNHQTYQYFDKRLRSAKAEGKAEGSAEGAAAATALAGIGVFEARGLKLTRAQRARISECRDLPTLRRWLAAAAVATKSVNEALGTANT